MAKLPEKFQKHVKYLRESTRAQIRQYEEVSHMLGLLTYLKDYPQFKEMKPYLSDWLDDGRPKLEVSVKSFPEVLPLLETLADWGCDFTGTKDNLTWSERIYYSSKVVVAASLVEGSSDCRRVIVGYKEPTPPQPIYAFECGDPLALPAANPDPHLPEVI